MDELKQLTEVAVELKGKIAKYDEEVKSLGTANTETKSEIAAIRAIADKLQTQLDAVDQKTTDRMVAQLAQAKSLGEVITGSDEFKSALAGGFNGRRPLFMQLKNGLFPELKTNITDTTLGSASSGLLQQVRLSGIARTAMQELRIRDLMQIRPLTTGNGFDWVRQSARTNAPSPQVEAAAKAESTYLWATSSDQVRTIAHFVNVTRQALDDVPWLRAEIDSELGYGLKVKEETEILSGSGTGEHLNGLITQATAYDTATYNVSADTKLDKLRHAKLQARLAGLATYAPSAFVLNPTDMHTMELIKDQANNVGHYVIGDPKGPSTTIKTIWGLPVVESDSMAAGTFLVGAFDTAAELVDRMAATVEISFEHDTNFTKNLATILCEERIGLAVKKAAAFIYGSSY